MIDIDIEIEVEDKKLKALVRRLKTAEGAVEVGFFNSAPYKTGRNAKHGVNIPTVAGFNEGELREDGSPYARPFMLPVATSRSTKKALKKAAQDLMVNGVKRHTVYKKLGATIRDEMMYDIQNGSYDSNTEKTIARKGFNWPLIETLTMNYSVKARVVKRADLGKKK